MTTPAEMLAEAADGFFLAAEHGRSDVLKALADHAQGQLDLREIVDPATGRTPLHVAVASGKTDAVRVLLAAGFPPDHESLPPGSNRHASNGHIAKTVDPPSRGAPASGDGGLLKPRQNTAYLLAKQLGAKDLVFVFHQFTIQQIAVNNVDGVRQMLDAGVDAGVTDGNAQNTLLHWAVTCSASDVLSFLLQCDDVQQRKVMDRLNAEGATPLHLACKANNVECMRLLLRYHADSLVQGQGCGAFKGRTAIEMATSKEIREIFETSKRQREQEERNDAKENGNLASVSSDAASESMDSDKAHATDANVVRRGSGSRRHLSEHETQNQKLLLQLEEKDLLITQLRKTIEALVVESQEIRKLGDERVVLDYVRKLRDRNLEDAEEHIRIQQDQLHQLKSEIRKSVVVQQISEPLDDHEASNSQSIAAAAVASSGQALASNSDARLPASPLRLGASSSSSLGGSRPPKLVWGEKPPGSNRGKVLGALWPFGSTSEEVQEIDGEVIMTV
ncbi:hypothetical protein FI667_g6364, partial [Globisporangium splendens]